MFFNDYSYLRPLRENDNSYGQGLGLIFTVKFTCRLRTLELQIMKNHTFLYKLNVFGHHGSCKKIYDMEFTL